MRMHPSARTAISRDGFSRPVRHMLDRGLLTRDRSFFDYGCGRGDDVSGLRALDFDADGWDPNHRPEAQRRGADIVNLGYVLNVIDNPAERATALREAWNLTLAVLAVRVLTTADRTADALTPWRDGFRTSRGTFQKYFDGDELMAFVDRTLGVPCVPVDPAHVLVFRDAQLEQAYLDFEPDGNHGLLSRGFEHPDRIAKRRVEFERVRAERPETAAGIARHLLRFGTVPDEEDMQEVSAIAEYGLRAREFCAALIASIGEDAWQTQLQRIHTRLLKSLALAHFRRTPKASDFDSRTKRAFRVHFGSFHEAVKLSLQELHKVGQPDVIETVCAQYGGGMLDEQALYVVQDDRPRLPLVLQLYVELGRLFYGELDDVDQFKIHKRSGKLTLLFYENFEERGTEQLQQRVKIDFRTRRMWVFGYDR
ncbi:MAG: DNA phosphorothioation-associated putative methyltransferase [Spirochaetaceae bacterium]|nr:MAG: DNA phosphorothioation-associated putative methyltransferase [Spirochaetaceae bacterium]